MDALIARARTLLTAANTYLTLAAAALPMVVAFLTDDVGLAEDHDIIRWSATVASVLGVAILVVRRAAEVIPADRGLLPPTTQPALNGWPPPPPPA